MNYSKNDRGPYILSLLLSLLLLLLLKFKIIALIPVVALILVLFTAFNIKLGLILYLIVLPLSLIIRDAIPTAPIIFSPSLVLGFFFNFLFNVNRYYFRKRILLYLSLIAVPILISTFIYQHYTSFNAVIGFSLSIIIAYHYGVSYLNYKNINKYFVFSIVLAGMIALIYALTSDISQKRLQASDNVRNLANILGLSIVFITLTILYYKDDLNKLLKYILIFLLIPLSLGLLMTVSRGVIITTLVTIIFSFLIHYFFTGKFINLLTTFFGIIVFISLIYIVGYGYFEANYGEYLIILEKRFQGEAVSSGSGIREYIWKQTFSTFKTHELIFGIGIDGFNYKSDLAQVYYYAHSIFVDTLASGGFVPLATLLIILIVNVIKSVRTKNTFSLGLLVYIILAYVSHGSVKSFEFWLLLALIIGMNQKVVKHLKIS